MSVETKMLRGMVEEIRLNAEREMPTSEEAHEYWTRTELDTARRLEAIADRLELQEIGL